MRTRPWLIIPVKSLLRGKSRLATVLSARGRRQLNELLLRRMLAIAARFPGLQRTAIVSGCPGALAVAAQYGAVALREPGRRGLNAAATWALRSVRARGAAAVMLAACDLPLVRGRDLRALARAGAELPHGVLLCPDEAGTGTNALHLGEGVQLRFRFGTASLHAHQREAQRLGLPVRLHPNARIAADIDTARDLRRWQRGLRRHRVTQRERAASQRRAAVKNPRRSAKKTAAGSQRTRARRT